MKTNIAVTFDGKPANLICDKKKQVLICKQPFKKDPEFTIDIADVESAEVITEQELKDKSVIGRAIVGGLLFGGVGAIVGGLSGTDKTKLVKYLSINTKDGKIYIMQTENGASICVDIRKVKAKLNK